MEKPLETIKQTAADLGNAAKGQFTMIEIMVWMSELVTTKDIDPLYDGLWKWGGMEGITRARIERFMVCYWMFYSVGASWAISQRQGQSFWNLCRIAAENKLDARQYVLGLAKEPEPVRWPRAHERRHFRGEKSVKAVDYLAEHFPMPEQLVVHLTAQGRGFTDIMAAAQKLPQFGPWIAFKIADMMERCCENTIVEPAGADVALMYKEPRDGLAMIAERTGMRPEAIMEQLQFTIGCLDAPGAPSKCSFQEIETCLCKWKSAQGGHYTLGEDIRAHRKELTRWGAHDLLECYPKNIA